MSLFRPRVIPVVLIDKTGQAIKTIKPGGIIIHIGLTQPGGNFDFRKTTLQEVTFIGTYCYTNSDFAKTLDILAKSKIGNLNWIEFRDLKKERQLSKKFMMENVFRPR